MIANSLTKYHVKYEDGTIKEIECEPTQIKKVISKSYHVPYENIILINTHNNRLYSASNSFIQFQNKSIDLNVLDINQILKENMNSKKKIIELQNNENDLQNEIVQLKETSREMITQIQKNKDDNKYIIQQKDQNFQQFQRMEQQHKEKLTAQLQLYEQKIAQINRNKEQLQQENENLQRKLQEQIQIAQKQERNFINEKFFLQQKGDNELNFNHQIYESQILALQVDITNMKHQINKQNNLIQQQKDEIEDITAFYKQQMQDLETEQKNLENNYKQKIQKLEKGINEINSSINLSDNNLNFHIKNICNTAIQEIEYIKKEMDNEEKNRNIEIQKKLKQENNDLQLKIQKLQQQIKNISSQLKIAETDLDYQYKKYQEEIDILNVQLNKAKKDLDDKQDEVNQYILTNNQLQSEKNELDQYNQEYEHRIQQLEQAKTKLENNINELEEKYRFKHNQHLQSEQTIITKNGEITMLESVIEKQKQQINKMIQKIGRLTEMLKQISNKNLGKGLEKVISPVGQLLNSRYGVQKFKDNPNCQSDETDYLVYRIKPSKNFIQSIRKGQFINLQQFLDLEPIGEIKSSRSIQPNEEGDLMKVYIIKVEDTQIKELRNRYLIRKDLQKGQNYDNKIDAAALSLNNILTQVFMDQFVKDLSELSIRVLQFSIAPQYVIQQKGKELYYYCEEIIENNIKQINGGEQDLGSSQDEQFLNSFSKYSHKLSQSELVISYINTVQEYMYDMIVTTEFGCFSEIDQGKDEYIRAVDAMESAQAINFGEFYNQKLELKALEFIQ
ncbi:unnamed protein product [Paramecium primaurelia]|uniref:Uncharacterized protein n=1 Tax=Paramecium primaurelia TaxID=5886 RepID=A0A8S1LS49_PARPR|nr:unnamed protein product [Paramecium primaurelia]